MDRWPSYPAGFSGSRPVIWRSPGSSRRPPALVAASGRRAARSAVAESSAPPAASCPRLGRRRARYPGAAEAGLAARSPGPCPRTSR